MSKTVVAKNNKIALIAPIIGIFAPGILVNLINIKGYDKYVYDTVYGALICLLVIILVYEILLN